MADSTYMTNRVKYTRPQAMLWSDSQGTINNGLYVPNNSEIGSLGSTQDFIILSDDNRSPIDIKTERIEQRKRMVNGRMRSYHIADKLIISTSWNMLPSRSFSQLPDFDSTGVQTSIAAKHTTDGGAGGEDLLNWYETHTGPFWVFLAYDKKHAFGSDDASYNHLTQYNQVVEMYISDFNYSIQKRGATNFDMWDVSVTLEEV